MNAWMDKFDIDENARVMAVIDAEGNRYFNVCDVTTGVFKTRDLYGWSYIRPVNLEGDKIPDNCARTAVFICSDSKSALISAQVREKIDKLIVSGQISLLEPAVYSFPKLLKYDMTMCYKLVYNLTHETGMYPGIDDDCQGDEKCKNGWRSSSECPHGPPTIMLFPEN